MGGGGVYYRGAYIPKTAILFSSETSDRFRSLLQIEIVPSLLIYIELTIWLAESVQWIFENSNEEESDKFLKRLLSRVGSKAFTSTSLVNLEKKTTFPAFNRKKLYKLRREEHGTTFLTIQIDVPHVC